MLECMFEKEFGKLWSVVGGAAGNEDGLFGEAADNNEDGIEALRLKELDNVVHQDGEPGAVTNREQLEKAVGVVAGNLGLETRLTSPDKSESER
ncbi:hypothetical protein C0993_011743 [Termitomyces sp. T159_Od127]|nr:hypothetical protein C0993_011743 [Termitomyces sp. T159_Od127]